MPALHITNGDCAANLLREITADRVVITPDPLFEGPVPAIGRAALRDVRARYLAGSDDAAYRAIREEMETTDSIVEDARRRGEVVLWFEHDLFDQLLLVRILDMLAPAGGAHESVSLICIDRHPAVDRFIGLGQLSSAQLEPLVDRREPVGPAQFETARRAWRAFRAPAPSSLDEVLVDRSCDVLPFLRPALLRFCAEYPSIRTGLSRTGESILEALEEAPMTGAALFRATQAREHAPFMGDTSFFAIVESLARARVPLVALADDGADVARAPASITTAGREVLAGHRDAVELNGLDEWRGGVHLNAAERKVWRWDAARETLV